MPWQPSVYMKSILAWTFALSALVLLILLLLPVNRQPTVLQVEPPPDVRDDTAPALVGAPDGAPLGATDGALAQAHALAPSRAPLRAPAPDLLSELSLDLSIELQTLSAALDAVVPRFFSGTELDPIDAASDDSLTWSLTIGSAKFDSRGGALLFRIPIDKGTVRVVGRVGARKKPGAFGWLRKIAGFDIDETIEFDGVIEGTLQPTLQPDWTIDPGLRATVSLSKAEAALFGRVLKISFRDAIRARIDTEVRRQAQQLRERLAADDRLATTVQRVWDAMHAVTVLSSRPPVWMIWQPVALSAGQPTASDGTVSVTLGTTVQAAIDVVPDKPDIGMRALPSPTLPREDGRTTLRIPVTMRLDRFRSVAPSLIGQSETMERAEGTITFQRLSIFAASDTLSIAVAVAVDTGRTGGFDATLYVTGTPVLDRYANRLHLVDARYDVNTRNALLGVADFLLEPSILHEIEKRSVFAILESELELLRRARIELDAIEASLPVWAEADLAIDSGQVSRVVAQDGWLMAVLEASGSVRLRIANLDVLLK